MSQMKLSVKIFLWIPFTIETTQLYCLAETLNQLVAITTDWCCGNQMDWELPSTKAE